MSKDNNFFILFFIAKKQIKSNMAQHVWSNQLRNGSEQVLDTISTLNQKKSSHSYCL